MTRTREQFIDRYKHRLAAMVLFMQTSERVDGPLARAARIFEMPGEIERLLGQMYDENAPAPASGNGKTPAAPAGAAQPQQGRM